MIRRLALAVGLSVLLVLGFGAAYGLSSALNGKALAGATKKTTSNGHTPVTLCHKPGTPAQKTLTVDDDAVPAHLDHGDYLGPCGSDVITTTLTEPTTTTVPITDTIPPTTMTLPPDTTTTEITTTVPIPPDTTTVPVEPTTVTVPTGSTVTVTVPGETVTQPATTITLPDVTVERDPETVTLPGETTTVTGTGTTTVVTITAPNKIVHPGFRVKTKVQAKIAHARRVAHVLARVHRIRARVKFLARRVFVVIRAAGVSRCQPGTAPFNGTCKAVVRGKG